MLPIVFVFDSQLVSNSLQFLATVADRNHYRHLFEDPAVLSSICEKVIIPNMEFRSLYWFSLFRLYLSAP